jgi:hypothetical protein
MVTVPSLWLAILLSAVLVFVASFVIHSFLKYHKTNFARVGNEEALRAALRPLDIPPGDYGVPYSGSMEEMKSAEYKARLEEGPVLLMTVMPNQPFDMGRSMGLWFAYLLVVGIFAAWVASRALAPGAEYLAVFCMVGVVSFAGYALALLQDSIWFGRKWSTTFKFLFDGVIYALLTGGVFGWLWPGV